MDRHREKLEDDAARAAEALAALEAAITFESAHRAWTDFLIYWRRALNHICAAGSRIHRKGWVKVDHRAKARLEIKYLWEARNADEHGLIDIAERQDPIQQLSIKGDVFIKSAKLSSSGSIISYVPLSADTEVVRRYFPEGIRLIGIKGRSESYEVPPGFELIHGGLPAPISLARIGMDFLHEVMKEAIAPP